ncbi:MAG: hypothetical protein JO107_01650, partial [Hyphomicrobiales bacterium]|nr:hypothetical protein [Hyphomicrobiales bacterium]MBV8661784.1 hypothetical protein [Hyphomicrobiales bacterium]
MTIFTFALGVLFVAAGLGGLAASVNLLPTEIGLLYAGCGALAICAGGVMAAIGALIHQLGAVKAAIERAQPREAWQIAAAPPLADVAPREPELSPAFEESGAPPVLAPEPRVAAAKDFEESHAEAGGPVEAEPEPEPAQEEDAVNVNRAGRLPTMSEIEHAIAEPEPAPTLVGRYSAGGSNYMIFSDGS